jgi:transposase-like protein
MASALHPFRPPFCPNPGCVFHLTTRGWRFHRKGHFRRRAAPQRIPRYRCTHCSRSFSSQTFHPTYWQKRPELLLPSFHRLLGCSAYRQIAREFDVSPTSIQRQLERLGRHCLLFHERHRPRGQPREPLVLDGFETFEHSQYWISEFHTLVGAQSHFAYAFTDSERRRSGRMRPDQKRKRARLERRFGRPDPRSVEHEITTLLTLALPTNAHVVLRSDDHRAYPRALRRTPAHFTHHVTHSTAPRTPQNPLFAANLFHGLIRHCSANHKRETIAFSKRRQHIAYRLALFQVWRNYLKSFSEKRRDGSPAQRLGLLPKRLCADELFAERQFPSRIPLPERLARYYRGEMPTRPLPRIQTHHLRYAQ